MNVQSGQTARSRAIWITVSGVLLALTALLGGALLRQASSSLAATPSSGRLTESVRTLTWDGETYPAGTTVPDRELCEVPGNCDEFDFYIQVPSSFTNTQELTVTIAISWTNPSDDYDLYVLDPEGNVAASSGTTGDPEQAAIICPRPNVTYTVQVVPFLIQNIPNSTYSGRVTLDIGAGTGCNPNIPPPPGPFRDTGGIVFNTNTLVDPQRQVGEPDIAVGPTSGDLVASGPWGTSTQQSFVWISHNNGDTYNVSNRVRPDVGPGGGDTSTEVDDQNYYYFTDLEALGNIAAARSTDGGNTFTRNSLSSYMAVVDRQWMALDDGPTNGAEDNTQFLTFRQIVNGSFVVSSTDGQTFLPAQADFTTPMNTGAPCGDLRFDPVDRYLYLPCTRGNTVSVASAHVDVNQRTGLTFTTSLAGNASGETGNLFPLLATDAAGNVYVTYVDSANHNVYLTYSTNHAQTWSQPVRLNGNDANTALFPWIVGGSAGRVAVAYLATERFGNPDSFPSWFNDPQGATTAKWYLYINYVFNADTPNPTIYQAQASQHPTHYGQVCTSGTTCLASGGDRSMADFLTLQHDNSGAMRIIYDDTTNQHHGPSVFEARQLAGPSLFGTTLNGTAPTNPVSDPADDAHYPHFSAAGPGPNYDALDIRSVGMAATGTDITVTMTISDLTQPLVLPGASSVLWLARWQSKSVGDSGEESYRIYYAGAKSTGGATPSFFYGTGTVAAGPDVGCTDNTPQNCKLLQYPAQFPTTGTFNPATGVIQVTVPRNGVGSPVNGSTLYSITGYTFGTRDNPTDFYDDVDVAKAFNYILPGGATPTPTSIPSTTTPTSTPTTGPTQTPGGPTPTPTVCNIQFEDVPPTNTFYPFVRCLACRHIIGGYPCGGSGEPCNANNDPYYRYNSPITRGQISKVVALSDELTTFPGPRIYEDVPEDSPFYIFIQQLSNAGYMGGYPCGQRPDEPCVAPDNRPYFRPNSPASRGQLSKIVSNAAGFSEPHTGQTYADVPTDSPFYLFIERLSSRSVMGGYPCGGVGEPCDSESRPYFRPNASVTRGQAAKITANTFHPGCRTP